MKAIKKQFYLLLSYVEERILHITALQKESQKTMENARLIHEEYLAQGTVSVQIAVLHRKELESDERFLAAVTKNLVGLEDLRLSIEKNLPNDEVIDKKLLKSYQKAYVGLLSLDLGSEA